MGERAPGHWLVADWRCCCGEDIFGGTEAYSALLWREHLAEAQPLNLDLAPEDSGERGGAGE